MIAINGTVTPGTADLITDFSGGTRGTGSPTGTGDMITFAMAKGTSANYVEQAANSYNTAETQANAMFVTNAALKYIVVQVGTDSYLFAEHSPNTGADAVVMLQGVSLSGIDYGNII